MDNLDKLLMSLRKSGVEIPDYIESVMRKVDIEDYTKYDSSGFYYDRPVVFLETLSGGVKNISAPHMIVTLLHNLELSLGQNVVVYGAKGGYVSALAAHIIGESGVVTLIDPSQEVIAHVSNNLRGFPTVQCHVADNTEHLELTNLSRVLVTGQIDELPDWLSAGLDEGGFAIAPIGDRMSQRLLKIEKQEAELFETDLGSVIFGPVDISDSIVETPSPSEMAELIEQIIELISDSGFIKNNDKQILYDLVADLRQLPDDLPPPDELDDPTEHPMLKLMLEKGEWFVSLWPLIQSMMGNRIASYYSSENDDEFNGHPEFIP